MGLRRLADTQKLSSTNATTIVTNASSKVTTVKLLTYNNITANPCDLSIYVVPDSAGNVGTASDTGNLVLPVITVPGNDGGFVEALWVLEDTNDTVQVKASVSNAIIIRADGLIQ